MSKRLYRSRSDAILGGVAGGLAKYFGVDVVVVRLLIVLMAFLFPTGGVIAAYIIAWLIIPLEPKAPEKVETRRLEKRLGTDEGRPATGAGIRSEAGEVQTGAPAPEGTESGTMPGPAGSGTEVRPPELIKGEAVKVSGNHDTATRHFLGWALMIIGAILLVRRFTPPFWWEMPFRVLTQWWPLALVALGVVIVVFALRR